MGERAAAAEIPVVTGDTKVVDAHRGMVVLRMGLGGTRVVDLLPGDQLPGIC